MPDKIAVVSYKRFLTEISSLYEGARKALVKAYWEIGKRIVQVEQQGAIKAAYGAGLLQKLSEDLSRELGQGFSERNLERMRSFYLHHPKSSAPTKLGWAHYVELMSLKDTKKRVYFEEKAAREGLDTRRIRELVRHEIVRQQVARNLIRSEEEVPYGSSAKPPLALLAPPKGLTLRTYRKGELPSRAGIVIDCGFYVYRTVTVQELKAVTVTDKPAYAYEAVVERVIDGDTLWAVIDVGFGTRVREKLRLRGIDCPELGSPEGEAAKRFVAKLLPPGVRILLVSSKTDKYTRYLADVFCKNKDGNEQYLNNLLLEAGLAVILYE